MSDLLGKQGAANSGCAVSVIDKGSESEDGLSIGAGFVIFTYTQISLEKIFFPPFMD